MASRRLSLSLLALAGTAWGGLLTVAGLWLLMIARDQSALGPWPRIIGGLTAVGAGLLVFMCLVADRLFPKASRRLVVWSELLSSVVVFLGVAWLVVLLANLLAPAA